MNTKKKSYVWTYFEDFFFTNQLQVEKAKYLLLESLISVYESSSDDGTKSSPVKSKKKELKRWSKLSATHFLGML